MVTLPVTSLSHHAQGVPGITSHGWSQEGMEELHKLPEVRSQPSYHHGNGPYNDVNIPGCWFFKLPHKASWVLLGLFLRASQSPCIPAPLVLLHSCVTLPVTRVLQHSWDPWDLVPWDRVVEMHH